MGNKAINVKVLLKQLGKIFDHRDKLVRTEGTALAIELYKWMGPSINQFISDLKPVQIKELNEEFEKVQPEEMAANRIKKKQEQANEESGMSTTGSKSDMPEEPSEPIDTAIDPYELADPVNVLDKIPKTLYEAVAAEKWKDRKEALEGLLEVLKPIKLENGDYHDLLSMLAKKMGDVNILVVTVAANCIEKIARGLRSNFAKYRSIVMFLFNLG